jgi:hypothetical protein
VTWCLLADGTLAGLTYNREPGALVSAWHSHTIGGSFGGGDAVVESIAVIPAPDETTDDLWLSVKRAINGETVRHIEYMKRPLDYGESISSGVYLDCAYTYSGSATTSITGLTHLAGESVTYLADGLDGTGTVNSSGVLTLATAASLVHVGYYETRALETVRIDSGPGDPVNTKALSKRVYGVAVEVVESAEGYVGTDDDYMDAMTFDDFASAGAVPTRITGLIEESINDDFGKKKFIRCEQRAPYPTVIASITARFEVSAE